nr:hypothetical protein [Tanacetum cinerariifolium]
TFKRKSKDVQINLVQAVDANLVVTKSSRIELENNSSENALSKLVNVSQMQMQEGKVDMGKALDAGLVVTESSGTKSDKQDIRSRLGNYTTHAVDADIRPVNDQESFAEEKVFANAALKNELRKLKGNSVDTKFAKLSILGKLVLQPLRNQSLVRKPNAFQSERPKFSKPRFASQVDVNNDLPKPVTPHHLLKTRNNNKLVELRSDTQIPNRQILQDIGRIFKTGGLRWIPTRKIFTSSITKVDSEPPNGSNEDITNPYECKQTLNVNAVVAPEPADSTGTPSATSIDQDAASPTHLDNDPFFGVLIPKPNSKESSSMEVIPTNVNQPPKHVRN